MPVRGSREILRFGVYEVGLEARELRKHGVRIRLSGQPFDLLRLFLERPGEVVSREEMQARLWPVDTFVDFERSLNAAVKKLRNALGDSPDRPLYIETVHRVGYRFIAPIARLTAEAAPPANPPPPDQQVPVPEPFATASPSPRRAAAIRSWIGLGALTGCLLLAGFVWLTFYRPVRPVLAETDREVLADLRNATQDPSFDSSLGQALRVKLQESPYLNLFSVGEAQHARREHSSTDKKGAGAVQAVAEEAARRACTTLGGAAVIEGAIAQSSSGYDIRLTASRCAGNHVIARAQQRAAARDQVLEALGRAARDLRIGLGEPESSVSKFDTPLSLATSSSLAALKAFSQGEEKRAVGMDYETIPDFKLAVDLDPNFALAYARLGVIYQNSQEWRLARQNFERAFATREHTSERERLYITAHYYGSITNEIDKELQVYELWRQVYPHDLVAPNNLSFIHSRSGQIEKALASARDAVRLAPQNAFCLASLARALQRSGNYGEAKSLYQRLVAHRQDGVSAHLARYQVAFGEGDQAEMKAQLDWAKGNPREGEILDAAAWGAAAGGEVARARSLFRQASRVGLKSGLREYAALVLLDDSQLEADMGLPGEAVRDVDEALSLAPDSATAEAYAAIALARLGAVKRALGLAAKVSKDSQLDTIMQNVTLATVYALAAIDENHPSEALQHLESAKPYDLGTDSNLTTICYRGETLMKLGRYPEAAAEFQRLLDARLMNPNSPYLVLAQLGLARTAARAGDLARARTDFESFFSTWRNADSNLPILRAARSEYLHLGS